MRRKEQRDNLIQFNQNIIKSNYDSSLNYHSLFLAYSCLLFMTMWLSILEYSSNSFVLYVSELYIALQIRELHRVYQKQRELMDEIKRRELHKQNLRLEASCSSSALLSKNVGKIFCSPNLPWSTSQSPVLFAESIQLAPVFAQEKNKQNFPAHASTVTEESLKDYKLPESKCKKVGKKLLDLQLPADEYIDSDEGENNVPFKLDLNVPCRLKVEPAAMSCDMEGPAHRMNNCLYDPSMRTKFRSQNLRGDVINKRQDLEGCSNNSLPENEKKCEWKSSGNSQYSNFYCTLYFQNFQLLNIVSSCIYTIITV